MHRNEDTLPLSLQTQWNIVVPNIIYMVQDLSGQHIYGYVPFHIAVKAVQLCMWMPVYEWITELVEIQYIPRNMHTVFALLCFVVVIHWLIFPYPSGLLHWHCGNLTIAPVPTKQPWWIWINTSCEFIMNDCVTTTKQSTTKPCACFLGYTVWMVCILPVSHGDISLIQWS